MANLQVDDLPLIPDVNNADAYAAKSNLDYRVRTGEPNGLATLDGGGQVPLSQLPALNFVSKTGDTMTGKLIISGNIAGGALSARNNGGVNAIDIGMGASGAADPTAFIANRANGSITFLANNALVATMTVGGGFSAVGNVAAGGDVTSIGNVVSNGGSVIGNANLVVATASPGGVFIRPGGPLSATAQTVFSTTRATYRAAIGSFFGPVGTQVGVRDIGWDNDIRRWQEIIEPSADWALYAFNAAGGLIAQRIVVSNSTGVVSAVNFNATSDASLKTAVTERTARSRLPDMLRFVEYLWKDSGQKGVGLIAQEVNAIAPEYVHEGRDGIMSIDKAGIALECVIGLAVRVRELEDRLGML